MSEEWDPFADPADAATAQEKGGPPEKASGTLKVGDFMEVVVTEGAHHGSWVACQLLSIDAMDSHTICIPMQPPIIGVELTCPGVPSSFLRKPLAPANTAVLMKYYPLPRPPEPELVPGDEDAVKPAWYDGKLTVAGRKLRVLVLHGTSSNSKIMTQQISPLRVTCQDDVDFIFTDGTIDASTIPNNPQYALMSKVFPGQKLYQFAKYAPGNGFDYSDLEDVMEVLQNFMHENGPIDGVLGTGQGSNLGTLLAAQAASGLGEPLSFVVHHGGTEAAWTWRFPQFFRKPLRIPSLHITGREDPFLHGHAVHANLYMNPEIETHSGDHRPYPRDRDEAKVLTNRVLAFMRTATAAAGPSKT